jgi:hypothetical protein
VEYDVFTSLLFWDEKKTKLLFCMFLFLSGIWFTNLGNNTRQPRQRRVIVTWCYTPTKTRRQWNTQLGNFSLQLPYKFQDLKIRFPLTNQPPSSAPPDRPWFTPQSGLDVRQPRLYIQKGRTILNLYSLPLSHEKNCVNLVSLADLRSLLIIYSCSYTQLGCINYSTSWYPP